MIRLAAFVAATLLLRPSEAAAQRKCTIDSSRALVERKIVVTLHRDRSEDTTRIAADLDHVLLAQDIAEVLLPPDSLQHAVAAGTFSADGNPYLAAARFEVRVAEGGGVESFRWLEEPGVEALGAAVETAVRRLGERGRLPMAVPDRPGSPRFRFALGELKEMAPRSVVLFTRTVRGLQLERDVEQLQAGPLRYPPRDAARGVEGRVDAEFVVDRSGRVEMKTIRVLAATNGEMAKSAKDALRQSRFRPAQIQGCPAPQVVRQRMSWSLGR